MFVDLFQCNSIKFITLQCNCSVADRPEAKATRTALDTNVHSEHDVYIHHVTELNLHGHVMQMLPADVYWSLLQEWYRCAKCDSN